MLLACLAAACVLALLGVRGTMSVQHFSLTGSAVTLRAIACVLALIATLLVMDGA